MSVKVATYNILDNSMATTKFFDLPKEEYLSLNYRVPLILNRLENLIRSKSIICLQEAGLTIMGAGIHQLFSNSNYYTLTSHYSTLPDRDFHGVVISFPTSKYSLIKYGEVRIGSKIIVPSDRNLAEVKNDNDVYEEATKRDVRMLWIVLKEKSTSKEFFLCTYHMPCTIWWIDVMTLHVNALFKTIEDLSDDLPIILAGDFNICKRDVKTGVLIPFLLDSGVDINKPTPLWEPSSKLRLINANDLSVNTTRTKNPGRDIFEGTLDYIFYRGFNIKEVVVPEIDGILPNDKEGSDHVPVYAELENR